MCDLFFCPPPCPRRRFLGRPRGCGLPRVTLPHTPSILDEPQQIRKPSPKRTANAQPPSPNPSRHRNALRPLCMPRSLCMSRRARRLPACCAMQMNRGFLRGARKIGLHILRRTTAHQTEQGRRGNEMLRTEGGSPPCNYVP